MNPLSTKAKLYLPSIISVGAGLLLWHLLPWRPVSLWPTIALGLLASVTLVFKVSGTTDRSHYNLSFVVYGCTLIGQGLEAALWVILISCAIEWIWLGYPRWYIQPFNIAAHVIAQTGAAIAYGLVNPTFGLLEPETAFAVLLAAAVYILLNHVLVGLVIWVVRGQNFSQSGVFQRLSLTLDFTMFAMGGAAAWAWNITPAAVLLVLIPLYLIYMTLRMPALERKTEIDPKTELFNARYFNKALAEQLKRVDHPKRPLSVVMADMDLLRHVNNTYGHLAGDVVLQGLADILKAEVRQSDIVSRFGGEEFALLLPGTDEETAFNICERIRHCIATTPFSVSTSVEPIHVTMSFGVAEWNDPSLSGQELIHRADVALYEAKEHGRNQTRIFGRTDALPRPAVAPELEATPQPVVEPTKVIAEKKADKKNGQETSAVTPPPHWYVNVYVGALTGLVIFFSAAFIQSSDQNWLGIGLFALLAFVAELTALTIYVRESTVSSSVVILVAGTILFGPVAALTLAIVAAIGAALKSRSPVCRIIFNAANLSLGNFAVVGLDKLFHPTIHRHVWSDWHEILLVLLSTMGIFFLTTALVAGAIKLDTGQKAVEVWRERYRWLAPYYLVLGVIAWALLYSYELAGTVGVFIIIVPLLMMRYSQKQYIEQTKLLVQQLKQKNSELSRHAEEITRLNEELLLTLARSIDLRDPHVMEHSRNVARYASLIAQELGMDADQVEQVRKAGLLHDIGKLGIPEAILFKPERLSADEYRQIQQHSQIGAELIQSCHSLQPLIPYVLYHHERVDGRGYPTGLRGEDIPLEARIICLADAVEAMASDRPYSRAKSPHEILDEVERQAGKQFDIQVANAFARIIEREGTGTIVNSARAVIAREQVPSNGVSPKVNMRPAPAF